MSSLWDCGNCGEKSVNEYHKCDPYERDAYLKQQYINEQYRKNPTEMMHRDIANMQEEIRKLRYELSKK